MSQSNDARKPKSKPIEKKMSEKEEDQLLRQLILEYESNGISVRREKLCRGQAFRVKSGQCFLANQKLFFLDKRLPLSQQVSLLTDQLGVLRKEELR